MSVIVRSRVVHRRRHTSSLRGRKLPGACRSSRQTLAVFRVAKTRMGCRQRPRDRASFYNRLFAPQLRPGFEIAAPQRAARVSTTGSSRRSCALDFDIARRSDSAGFYNRLSAPQLRPGLRDRPPQRQRGCLQQALRAAVAPWISRSPAAATARVYYNRLFAPQLRQQLRTRTKCARQPGASSKILPGFRMPLGSSACLRVRISASSSGERERCR